MSVRLSPRQTVSTCQRGSHFAGLREIWYLRILRRSAEKLQIWLKSYQNIGHFTWRPKQFYTVDSRMKHFVGRNECKVAFPWQQRLQKSDTTSRYKCTACLIYLLSSSHPGQNFLQTVTNTSLFSQPGPQSDPGIHSGDSKSAPIWVVWNW